MTNLRGRLLVSGRLSPGTMHVESGRITRIDLDADRFSGSDLPVIAPGLVDLHVHGFGGFDPLEDLGSMAHALARAGTTTFQPTLFPAEPTQLGEQAEACWTVAQDLATRSDGSAHAVGLHLEGPFVNRERAGALSVQDLAEPSVAALRAILGPATGGGRGIRTMTLAPELPGSAELIEELVRSGVRVSLGHSSATADNARRAARAGAKGATHLFNAMGPLHHREVGLAGFALSSAALFAELIGDLVHVGADAVELALAVRGPRGLCLVSDALRGAGTGCDAFESHGHAHVVRDGAAYYPPAASGGEARLAGSALSQLEMVRKLVQRGVLGAADALTMASETPARALGIERELGVLAPGSRADFVLLEPETLALREVFVDGVRVT